MKTVSVNLYEFKELSPEAQQKALEKLWDLNVNHGWWEFLYEDAEAIGLKIESFDLDRNLCAIKFEETGFETAHSILDNHGKDCATHALALSFLEDTSKISVSVDENEEEYKDQLEAIELGFKKGLKKEYLQMLQDTYNDLTSKATIIETIEANEYFFTEDGKLSNLK